MTANVFISFDHDDNNQVGSNCLTKIRIIRWIFMIIH